MNKKNIKKDIRDAIDEYITDPQLSEKKILEKGKTLTGVILYLKEGRTGDFYVCDLKEKSKKRPMIWALLYRLDCQKKDMKDC